MDECHHVSAFSFERVLKKVKAKYVVGLTATPVRKDGHHPIILMQCGPIRFNVSSKKQASASAFRYEVIPRLTEFTVPPEWSDIGIQDIYMSHQRVHRALFCRRVLALAKAVQRGHPQN